MCYTSEHRHLPSQNSCKTKLAADCRHKGRRHGRLATLEHALQQLTARRGLQSNAWRAACAATQNNAHTRIHTNPTKIELQQPLTAPGRALSFIRQGTPLSKRRHHRSFPQPPHTRAKKATKKRPIPHVERRATRATPRVMCHLKPLSTHSHKADSVFSNTQQRKRKKKPQQHQLKQKKGPSHSTKVKQPIHKSNAASNCRD